MKHLYAKSATVNPLKMSQPLGAALAYMGIKGSMPLFHGSQGCTAFALVLMVRHFREPIPLQTTAINELTAIMGSSDSVDQAILNIWKRTSPEFIGIATTGLSETRGEDILGDLALFKKKHPEMENVMIVQASTPDYTGTLGDGWAAAITGIIDQTEFLTNQKKTGLVNVLPGSHLGPGDVDEIIEMIQSFGLETIVLPDLSGSLYGNQYDNFIPTTSGGTDSKMIPHMGMGEITIAIGSHMEGAAKKLRDKTGVPFVVFDSLMGLESVDEFISFLSRFSGKKVPKSFDKWRQRLVDVMLDGHFFFSGKNISLAGEPDLVFTYAKWFHDMGANISFAAVPNYLPVLDQLHEYIQPVIGDLEDLEVESGKIDLIVANAHGRQAAERLQTPLYRIGFPIFDRIGTAHSCHVGYRGTMENVIHVANLFLDNEKEG